MRDPKTHFTEEELANNTVQVAQVFAKYALALAAHEKAKSDPVQNVATGQALYAAESALKTLALDNANAFPEQLANIRAALFADLPKWSAPG